MTLDFFVDLSAELPNLRHFFVASYEVGVLKMQKALPQSERRRNKGNLGRKWKKAIDRVINTARENSIEEAIRLVQEQIVPGIAYGTTIDQAQKILEEFDKAYKGLGGIYDERISKEAVIIYAIRG